MYECQSVECAFTSPVIIESGMLVMYCMQFVMSVYVVYMASWWSDVVFLGAMYMLAMVMSLKCFVCILRSCISVLSVLMTCCVLKCGICGVLDAEVSFASCIVMMPGWVVCSLCHFH